MVKCTASGKWFCNSRGHTNGAHIIQHLVRSRFREVSLHPESPLGARGVCAWSGGGGAVGASMFVACSCVQATACSSATTAAAARCSFSASSPRRCARGRAQCWWRRLTTSPCARVRAFAPQGDAVVVLLCREPCLNLGALKDMQVRVCVNARVRVREPGGAAERTPLTRRRSGILRSGRRLLTTGSFCRGSYACRQSGSRRGRGTSRVRPAPALRARCALEDPGAAALRRRPDRKAGGPVEVEPGRDARGPGEAGHRRRADAREHPLR